MGKSKSTAAGCIFLAISLPLYYTVIGWILTALPTPTWVWVAFWVWLPVSLMAAMTRIVLDGTD